MWELVLGDLMIRAVVASDPTWTTVRVPSEQPTIQAGIDATSRSGDTVLVAPGTYTGPGNRGLDFHGRDIIVRSETGPLQTVIDCEHADRAFRLHSGETSASAVQGLTIRNGAENGGAGAWCMGASTTFADCIFEGNEAASFGGAVYCNSYGTPSPTFTHCTFAGNSAGDWGGAVFCDLSEPLFESCTFVGNAAGVGGGVHLLAGCSASFENTIIAFSTEGAAIVLGGNSTASLGCCDLYGNAGGDWIGGIASQLGANGNIAEDPLFCNLGAHDYRLQQNSPCAPGSAPNPECDLIGAWGVGCQSSAEPASWGAIKAMFR